MCTHRPITNRTDTHFPSPTLFRSRHARVPETGEPTGDPAIYARTIQRIRGASDAVINLTTGGSTTMTVAERLKAALYFKPEMCSLNMGSINFALFNAAKRITEWKHDWEKAYVLGSDDYVFRNTFKDIRYILETMGGKSEERRVGQEGVVRVDIGGG